MLAQPRVPRNAKGVASMSRVAIRCRAGHAAVTTVRVPVALASEAPIELDVDALYKRAEARAKALIQLEEQEMADRTKVKIVLPCKIGLGESWKIVGKCPELGNMKPEVAPYMTWNQGDIWTLELKVRPGILSYKAVLRKPDGQYLWEDGPERTFEMPYGGPAKELQVTGIKFPPF
ncbi:hypothetical protein TSOC_000662 [Tetrabaena socialis]|uniref:CBM20 domain-containing protein n=1 Tax=Tetrabaena socialis TaxID=47790 RepID=A0A2J8AIM4_9CHLO|nr:hypothetical protein TSOC_000662 [Tetrabaena socialis]|eukprot:PNH12370.1 hypothetical protein TSOC_000662 [Tetrabaena socialis]